MFAALMTFAVKGIIATRTIQSYHNVFSGHQRLVTTTLGIALVFFPATQITSLWSYELWMFGGTLFFVGLAVFFFFVYGRLKADARDREGHDFSRATVRPKALWPLGHEASRR